MLLGPARPTRPPPLDVRTTRFLAFDRLPDPLRIELAALRDPGKTLFHKPAEGWLSG
jgi:hypothetical protein